MATQGSTKLRRRYRIATRAVVAVTLVTLVAAVWLARDWAGGRAASLLRANAEESLALQVEALAGVMEKYRLIPPLLSRRADVGALFDGPSDPERAESVRGILMKVAASSGARDIVIADMDGTVLLSARGLASTGAITRSGIPAIVAQRRLGRAALRLADDSRAYAFASHIPSANGVDDAGMVIVMVPFGAIEANWSLSSHPIFVTDAREIVFLANRPDWVGRPWKAAEAAPDIVPLSFSAGDLVRVPETGRRFVEAERVIPILGWTMHVLVDEMPVVLARRNAGWLAGLAALLTGMIVLLILVRQEMQQARARREKAQSLRLERLVRDRTAELSALNASMRDEIEVRRQTEEQLRNTQKELVHAAKLAVIGQMSAGLTHEYNQPLAAIKTYADNAATMIERGKADGVPDVLARIGQMVDRMSALSRTLLTFSRKPATAFAPALVETVVSEALLLVGQKAKRANVEIRTNIEPGLTALTGPIRLSQVIVNIVANGIDAICGDGDRAPTGAAIDIRASGDGDRVRIVIADNGPGIEPAARDHIFEPFFTTKPVGSGLGLGLSIVDSLVRDLNGTVRVEERPGGGACFVIELPSSEANAQAAE